MRNSKFINAGEISLIVYDFDGVLTDNKVIVREDGIESVTVNRADGLAIKLIKNMGIRQIIISTEKNKVVSSRAKKLGLPVIKGVDDKKKVLDNYCRKNKIALKKVIYVGNDLNDLEAMLSVGTPVCPIDAYEEIKNISKIIIDATGGGGVVRRLINHIKGEE